MVSKSHQTNSAKLRSASFFAIAKACVKAGFFGLSIGFAGQSIAMDAPSKEAIALAKSTIILDSHIDVPYRVEEKWADVTVETGSGDFDYPRAKQGGLNAAFMSIYVPAHLEKQGGSIQLANRLIDSVEAIVGRAPEKFAIATSVEDVQRQFKAGLISLPMGMENGTPIEGDLENLQFFYDRGVRYITLAHSLSNHISDSSYDLRRLWRGLSPFGKDLVRAMNKMGMMIDISHVSDDAFYQVLSITETPVIASHSSLRRFTPGFERNMNDDMIKALAENDGVIMINFGSGFVTSMARRWSDRLSAKLKEANVEWGTEEAAKIRSKWEKEKPYPYATLSQVLDHVDHVVSLVGINHVGIGSDYDGVGDSLPRDLKDVSYYPYFVQGLLDRGYSKADIKKILSGNFLRVWKAVEDYAKSKQ